MQLAGRDPLKLVDAAIDTITEAIDGALPGEVAALTKMLFDALDRRKGLEPPAQGAVGEGRAQRAARRAGAVADGVAARGGVKRGR